MLRKLLPVLIILGVGAAGLGGGMALRPAATAEAAAPGHDAADDAHAGEAEEMEAAAGDHGEPLHAYVKLNNQFVVPIVENGRVAALVVLSLSLEVTPGATERVYEMEPKLRDGLLQVMFDHANSGGFTGAFTEGGTLTVLRHALREAAVRIFGQDITDVLIVDIVRQDN